MTRPDLAFSFSQISKFLQYPGEAHLAAAYRVLAYLKGTLHQGFHVNFSGVSDFANFYMYTRKRKTAKSASLSKFLSPLHVNFSEVSDFSGLF
jgi:hypothetical protein